MIVSYFSDSAFQFFFCFVLFFLLLSQHIVTCYGSTLLPQFLAMYRVTVESEDTYLLVMRNVFSHRLHVHKKYDLKVPLQRGILKIPCTVRQFVVLFEVLLFDGD